MPRTTYRKDHRLRAFGAVAAALLAGLVTTACSSDTPGGGGSAQAPSILTVSGADRQQQLEDAARKEGSLNWYTSLAGDSYQNISKAFTAKYPFIKINVFRGAQNDVVTRVKQELSAGQPSADALEVTSDGIELFDDQGQLADFTNQYAAKIPDTYKKAGSAPGTVRYATNRISYIGFGYNTQKVPADLVPSSLPDLAKPELARQLSVASSTTGVRWVGSVLHDLGEDKGTALLKQLGQEGMKVQSVSGAALMGLVGSGEVGASPSVFQSHASDLIKKGSPVKWIPVGSVVPNLGDVAVLKSAKHPAAAVLMNDFLLGPEGQKILEGLGYSSPLDKADFTVWAPEEDYKSVAEYQAAYKKWQGILNQSFNG
jgi:iron(III) transport system substrate-binding protein